MNKKFSLLLFLSFSLRAMEHSDQKRYCFEFKLRDNKKVCHWYCPYPGCTYAAFRKYDVITHMRVHSGERPYLCLVCGQSFTTLSNARRHGRHVHTLIKKG